MPRQFSPFIRPFTNLLPRRLPRAVRGLDHNDRLISTTSRAIPLVTYETSGRNSTLYLADNLRVLEMWRSFQLPDFPKMDFWSELKLRLMDLFKEALAHVFFNVLFSAERNVLHFTGKHDTGYI